MFANAWRWLTARLSNNQHRLLRLSVQRDPLYPSFWQPTLTPDRHPGLQIQIHLEASNMTARPCWIVAAELAGMPALQTVIGVRDPRTREFAPDNPLAPGRITTLSLHFLTDGQSPSSDEPFDATVILTDHEGERHLVKVIMH
jgi:hypothetical protein